MRCPKTRSSHTGVSALAIDQACPLRPLDRRRPEDRLRLGGRRQRPGVPACPGDDPSRHNPSHGLADNPGHVADAPGAYHHHGLRSRWLWRRRLRCGRRDDPALRPTVLGPPRRPTGIRVSDGFGRRRSAPSRATPPATCRRPTPRRSPSCLCRRRRSRCMRDQLDDRRGRLDDDRPGQGRDRRYLLSESNATPVRATRAGST